MPMPTELAEPAAERNSPLEIFHLAIIKGVDPDKMGKLLDLHERMEAKKAEETFGKALERFQRTCPVIVGTSGIPDKQGNIKYYYASYDEIQTVIQPFLDDCGIVLTFDSKTEATTAGLLMTTTCRVRVGSHCEPSSVTLGLPQIPNSNISQQAGGALSYGKRYAVILALNLKVKGEDNDASKLDPMLSPEQVQVLNTLFDDCRKAGNEVDAARFWTYIGCASMNECPASKFELAKFELERKRKAKKT
jgi:hypothetical protein